MQELSSWERIEISRHPERPLAKDFIHALCSDFEPVFGDRLFGDDPALIAGWGHIEGERFLLLGQEKGRKEEKLRYHFGMMHPEGYRKAFRCMEIAERFGIPVVTIIDTPGASADLASEERGQGVAIAENLAKMSSLKVPIIALIIGEGCSGGALGLGVADRIAMLEHAYYSVISPESCASILWSDPTQKEKAASKLGLHSEFLLEKKIIDFCLKEPLGGAHLDPKAVFSLVRNFILETIEELQRFSSDELVEKRYQKYRFMGQSLR